MSRRPSRARDLAQLMLVTSAGVGVGVALVGVLPVRWEKLVALVLTIVWFVVWICVTSVVLLRWDSGA